MTHTYEGRPCPRGHTTRYLSGHHCVTCKQSAALNRYHAARSTRTPARAKPKPAPTTTPKARLTRSAAPAGAAAAAPAYDATAARELWVAAGNVVPASGLFSGWPCKRGHTLRDADRGSKCTPCESLRRYRALAIGYDNMGGWIEAGNLEPDPSSPTFVGWPCRNGHTVRSTEAPWGCLECREEQRNRSSQKASDQYEAAANWTDAGRSPLRFFGGQRMLILSEDPKVWVAEILGTHDHWGFRRRFLERNRVAGGAEFELPRVDGLYEVGRVTVGEGRMARAFFQIRNGAAECIPREQAHQIAEARP